MSTHYRLDGFLLERIYWNGAVEAGIYASAYRLVDAANMVGYLIAAFLIPFIARHQNDAQLIAPVVRNARHGLMFYSIGIVAFALIFSDWIQQVFYHSDHYYNSMVIQLSLASLPGYFLVHLYGAILTAFSKFKSFISILAIAVFLNIILNMLLIPYDGAYGCAIAAVISQYFAGIACYVVATKDQRLSSDSKGMALYVLYGLLLSLFFYVASLLIKNVWMIILLIFFIFIGIVLMRIKDVRKIVGLVRN
jgi:O-antigen/teichoic acid export membrane protein